jgi:hypothetical protein
MLKLVFLVAISLLNIACGNGLFPVHEQTSVRYVETSQGEPILLQESSAASNCLYVLNSRQNSINVQLFNNWQFVTESFRPPIVESNGSLVNPLLATTSYAGQLQIFENLWKRELSEKVVSAPVSYFACPGHDYANEDTYESATSSAVYAFHQIAEELKRIDLNIKPVHLKVAPLFELKQEYFEAGRRTLRTSKLVNNAFYFPAKNEIVFLPQGRKEDGLIPFSAVPLWKIPFVGAHEYGHHLFNSLTPHFQTDQQHRSLELPHLCFDNTEGLSKNQRDIDGASRKVTRKDIADSFNEGFADLFARVVIDKNYSLTGIGCLEFSRDVDHARFASGVAKRLDSNALAVFFANKRIKTFNCYREQDYQDPHIIGAIIAHGMYQLYEAARLNKRKRLETMIDWLKEVDNNYQRIRSLALEDQLNHMLFLGIKVASNKNNINQSHICRIVGEYFPTIQSYYSCK